MRDLTHLFVAGGARRPEQERRGVQAVDAGLDVADVPAFLGLTSQRNELQRRIVHRCQTAGAGERELLRAPVVIEDRAEGGAEIERKRLEHRVDGNPVFEALRQGGGLHAVVLLARVFRGEPVHAGPKAAGPVAVGGGGPCAGFRVGPAYFQVGHRRAMLVVVAPAHGLTRLPTTATTVQAVLEKASYSRRKADGYRKRDVSSVGRCCFSMGVSVVCLRSNFKPR